MENTEDVYVRVCVKDFDLMNECWRLANGFPAQAQFFFDWANAAKTPEDKAIRRLALQGCKYGNPIDYYNWIVPYAETWID